MQFNYILKVQNLQKYYGGKGVVTKAIDNISFNVEKGEFLGIMGASGSGKTTLLNCISSNDIVTSGKIYIDNIDITTLKEKQLAKIRREKIGFIFQDYNLLDTLTVYENIALALSINKTKPKEISKKITNISKILDIEDILNKYPFQLSGGEKQRVASARALIVEPSILLADEPTGALDSKASDTFMNYLRKINQQYQTSILMVTHDALSASYCNKVLFIKDGKVFNNLVKGEESRQSFFVRVMEIVSLLGGKLNAD